MYLGTFAFARVLVAINPDENGCVDWATFTDRNVSIWLEGDNLITESTQSADDGSTLTHPAFQVIPRDDWRNLHYHTPITREAAGLPPLNFATDGQGNPLPLPPTP